MYIIIVGIVLSIAIFFFACNLWNYYNWCLRDVTVRAPLPPGSFGLPVIGQTYLFLLFKTKFFDDRRREFGSIYKTHLFGQPTIRITDASDINTILKDGCQNITNLWPKSAHALLEGGIALETSSGLHKRKRMLVLQAFCHDELSRHVPIMVDTCKEYVTRWTMTSETVYLYPELRTLAFHVACRCLLGISPTQDDLSTFMELFRDFVNGMFCLPIDLPGLTFHKALEARRHLLIKLDACMQEQNPSGITEDTTGVLNMLCNKGGMTSSNAENMVLELLFAGHASTASAATTMVINLCKHPRVHDYILKELTGAHDPLTYDVINDLKHVDSVVKESLRLNPPIGAGYRRVTKTFTCKGYQIPKDWSVIYGIRESHENSTMASSPSAFMPERWLSEDRSKLAGEFLTFGNGKHKCVGRHFAEVFLKVFLTVLFKHCKVCLVNDNVDIERFPVPHPKDDLPVVFEKSSFVKQE